MSKGWMIAIGIVLAVFVVAALTREPTLTPARRTTPAPIEDATRIPYTQAQYPKYWAEWGADGVARIERARPGAAKIASLDPACDKVALSELSERARPPNDIVLFALCENTHKIYVTEEEALAALR